MIQQIFYNCEADCTVLMQWCKSVVLVFISRGGGGGGGGGAHPLHPFASSAPGWILAKVFLPINFWTKNLNSLKARGQYPAIWFKQSWSIKDVSYDQKEIVSCGANAGNPEPILPTQVANQNTGFYCTFQRHSFSSDFKCM